MGAIQNEGPSMPSNATPDRASMPRLRFTARQVHRTLQITGAVCGTVLLILFFTRC